MFSNVCIWLVLGWSVNKLARAVTRWTKACYKCLVIGIFHFVPKRTDGPKRDPRGNSSAVVKPNMHNAIPIKHTNGIPTNIDHIPSNTMHSGSSAMLYVFEDNEAEIKMIIKGRSPTMRHVSRTHAVAVDWLFDRISLDRKIQIRYIDSKYQLADISTKGVSRVMRGIIFIICSTLTI